MPSFDQLCERARRIGVDKIAYPIDVFSTARQLADHPDTRANLKVLLELAHDTENYFTRWAAVRTINLLGPSAITDARDVLLQRLDLEDYDLAKTEIKAALAKLDALSSRVDR